MSSIRNNCPVILQTGFRIFFLGAALYTILSMFVWLSFYVLGGNIFVAMPVSVWHAHEMIFGFVMAVVAGFLLTAVSNWTGLPTLSGTPLLILFLIWLSARILAFMSSTVPSWIMAICDLSFLIFLAWAVVRPIVAVQQWRQSAVISKIILIFLSGIIFYLALSHADLLVERKSLRFAVYMIVSLIFTISRRVLPFFIERGVGYQVTLRNNKKLDIASLVLLVSFSILDVFWPQPQVIMILSILLAVIHSVRLRGWYTPGIWGKPLLWILFVGYLFLIMGFVLKSFTVILGVSDDLALHAFTAGGIGIFILGMMARVSWGHTGRNIAEAPQGLPFMFAPLILGAMIRVFMPIMFPDHYLWWIALSQISWMFAFSMFLLFYYRILITRRPDGKWG